MTNTPKLQANKTISEILEQLWEKRGRHSKLPTYPKVESIAEATQAITQAMLDALPGKHEVDPIGNADYRYCMGRNNAIEEMESAIKKMGGE